MATSRDEGGARPMDAQKGTLVQEAWNSYLPDVVPLNAPAAARGVSHIADRTASRLVQYCAAKQVAKQLGVTAPLPEAR